MQLSKEHLIQSIISLSEFPDDGAKQNTKTYLSALPLADLQAKREALITDPVEAAMDSARYAREVLKIYKTSGLRNTSENDAALDRIFGPALSLELFRSYCDQNPVAARLNFIWDGEPFGKAKQAEVAREAAEMHAYEAFCEAAKLVSVSGQANIAPNAANFSLIRNSINEPATVQRIVEALTSGSVKGLARNDEATIGAWRREREVRERESLCRFLAEAKFGRKKTDTRPPNVIQHDIELEFQRLMGSRYTPTEVLRQQVAEMKEARRLSQLSPEELRAEARRGQPQSVQTTPALPAGMTAQRIKQSSPEQIRFLRSRYGGETLDSRLAGRS